MGVRSSWEGAFGNASAWMASGSLFPPFPSSLMGDVKEF